MTWTSPVLSAKHPLRLAVDCDLSHMATQWALAQFDEEGERLLAVAIGGMTNAELWQKICEEIPGVRDARVYVMPDLRYDQWFFVSSHGRILYSPGA
jgi:hypothetical protein